MGENESFDLDPAAGAPDPGHAERRDHRGRRVRRIRLAGPRAGAERRENVRTLAERAAVPVSP